MVNKFKVWLFMKMFPYAYHMMWRHAYGLNEEWHSDVTPEQRNYFNGQRIICLRLMESIRKERIAESVGEQKYVRDNERQKC